MKYSLLLICLIFTAGLSAQKKVANPRNGEIIFMHSEPGDDPLKCRTYNYHFLFRNQHIISYQFINGSKVGGDTFINQDKGTFYTMQGNSGGQFLSPSVYKYSDKPVIITEFREDTKIINGYLCFKVIVSPKEKDKDLQGAELWVTDRIKCRYHPLINHKQVLRKYYPLEIVIRDEVDENNNVVYVSHIERLE